ncbi:histone family protein [Candidatus Woesearchaeota archaeon]|nr:histone family protein [Candidatus Woesearchaeota archaeon]
MPNKKGIPLAAMERLLKHAGAHRVSEEAKSALKQALEEYAQKIGEGATKYSAHAGRKTVKAEDIILATKI